VNRAYGPVDPVHGIQSTGLQHSEMIPVVELAIDDGDLISWRVIFRSNLGHQIRDGRRRPSGSGAAPAHDDAPWELTGCSEAQLSTGFHPTTSQWCGKIVLLTFERWRATVAAGNWEVVRPRLDDVEGDLRCLSNNGDNSYGGGGPLLSSWDGRLGTSSNTDVVVR
jgi:hypothetical protein